MTYTDGRRLVADSFRELVEPLESGVFCKGVLISKFTYRLSSRYLAAMAEEFAFHEFGKGLVPALDALGVRFWKGQLTGPEYLKRKTTVLKAEFRARWKSLVASSTRISAQEVNGVLQKWGRPWPDRSCRVKERRRRVGDSLESWSRAVRTAAGGRCQADGCRSAGTQAHHLTPIEFGGDPFGTGVWLCAKHHHQLHWAANRQAVPRGRGRHGARVGRLRREKTTGSAGRTLRPTSARS